MKRVAGKVKPNETTPTSPKNIPFDSSLILRVIFIIQHSGTLTARPPKEVSL